MSRIETLLNAAIDGGESLPDFAPLSRSEAYLKACLEKSGTEGLPSPISRLDVLLYELAAIFAQGGAPSKGGIAQMVDKSIAELTSSDLAGATQIGDYAFYNLKDLKSVEIPATVIKIKNRAFAYCSSLTSVVIPSSVIEIESNAFRYCDQLNSVTIESQTITIGSSAFSIGTETNKFTITMLATTPPKIEANSFNVATLSKIVVPAGCGAAYRAAYGWIAYTSYIVEAGA